MLVFGVTADHKVIEKQRTALRNSSSRELPGGNVFIIQLGQKRTMPHQSWLVLLVRCWVFNGNQSKLEQGKV